MNPIVKWVGGKRRSLDRLLPLLPETWGTYYEPFAGGLAMALRLRPSSAVVGDACNPLIDTYRTVRGQPDEVARHLDLLLDEYRVFREETYYRVRAAWNSGDPRTPRAAAIFIFLNKTGFNGLYRTNSRGELNVPWGRVKRPALPTVDDLRAFAGVTQGWQFACADFARMATLARPGDLVYLDPPYDGTFAGYTAEGFASSDQVRLAEECTRLDQIGARWLLSTSDTPMIRALYRGFEFRPIDAMCAVGGRGAKRGKRAEIAITNY